MGDLDFRIEFSAEAREPALALAGETILLFEENPI